MSEVPRVGRVLDAIGLTVFLTGGLLYARAWLGFREVQEYVPPPDAPAWAAVEIADGYWLLQKVGAGVMIAGVAVFVFAWWVARKVGGRPERP